MKLFKKKNNPLWDRLLIEKNMKLKTNKMKTCKDCKYYKKIKEDNYVMKCEYRGYKYTHSDKDGCQDYAKKSKPMKRNKQETNLIKEAYNSNDICSDWKTKIKETFSDIKFEKELAESWEEYCEIVGEEITNVMFCKVETITSEREDSSPCATIYTSYRGRTLLNDKYTALYKLELLRDHYNDGRKPDYEKSYNKHQIYYRDRTSSKIPNQLQRFNRTSQRFNMSLFKIYKEAEYKYTEIYGSIYATTLNDNIINIFQIVDYKEGIQYAKCMLGNPHQLEFDLNKENTKLI